MITSSSNSQVKHVAQLNARGKLRKEERLFAAEGDQTVSGGSAGAPGKGVCLRKL